MNCYNDINKGTSASLLEVVSTVLLVVLSIAEIFQPPLNMLVLLVGFSGWIFYMFKRYSSLFPSDKKIITSVLALSLIEVFYIVVGLSDADLVGVFTFRLLTLGLALVVSVTLLRICNYQQSILVTASILISICLRMYRCFIQGRDMIVVNLQDEASLLEGANVSSAFMFLSIICFIYLLHSKIKWTKIAAVVLIFMATYINFLILQRATNVIFTIVAFALVLVFNFRQSKFVWFLLISIFIALYLMKSTDLFIPIFDWLASIMPDRVGERIMEVSLAMQYEDIYTSSGSLSGRDLLMKQSLQTFVSSPVNFVFGVGEQSNNLIVGNHSYFLDMLAKYGIIGGILVFKLFKNQYYFLSSFLDKDKERTLFNQTMVVFVFYLIRNIYGSTSFDFIVYIILLLLPCMLILLNHQKEKI